MQYSQKTKELIDRMCRNVERRDFILDKKKAEECILKTYDLFNLKRPKRIIWYVDIFGEFDDKAVSALSASSARSARSASSALSALSASSARSALSALSASSARSASSALSALSARSALDYDFDWFLFEHEYCHNQKDNPGDEPNENDYKFLEYCELLMQAKEYGLGYRVEYENTLHFVPTPIVKIDEQNRFHHFLEAAIRWKGGKELYYLWGVNFPVKLFKQVVGKTLTFKEIAKLDNIEQRMVAFKLNPEVLEEAGTLINKSERGNELYEVKDIFFQTEYFVKYKCPSTDRIYFKCVDPEIGKKENADEAQAWSFQIELKEYNKLKIES